MVFRRSLRPYSLLPVLASLPYVLANDILSTEGFTPCLDSPTVQVNALNITFDRTTNVVVFDVSGTSTQVQNVTAFLKVSAYGIDVYDNTFDPCDKAAGTYVSQLCPIPAGTFSASGSQKVPDKYASLIPGIAYTIPDLGGAGKLELTSTATGKQVACVESTVGNGRTFNVPAVKYAAIGIAGAALLVSGLSALTAVGSAGNVGAATSSPTFTETVGWFQGVAMNGMLSVNYPGIYRSFTQNFGFSTGLISWGAMQQSIDNFRKSTGGNLTQNSVEYLKNSTLVYESGSVNDVTRRSLAYILNFARELNTNVNGTTVTGNGTAPSNSTLPTNINSVSGIQAYAEQLMIPHSNTFMTVLLFFAIVLAAITAGILLFKVILEAWALFGTFPKNLEGFRKRYWWLLAKTITNLILVLYGVWTLYCIYQFKIGDSWAAKVLAGVTLGIFTIILVGFTIKIWLKARTAKQIEGDTSALFDDKETWIKYSIFYDSYKKSYWWLFVPIIIYMFAKGCVIAGAEGHGLIQCGGQLIIDALLLLLLLFIRPYSLKSGNWINIVIQVVRVLSVVCILVFVEELGVDQTTQTITGLVLIVVQGVLTGLLAILIAVNALINCIRMNPHRRARKEAEKAKLENDELTPLDAHNSWLMRPMDKQPQLGVNPIFGRGRLVGDYDAVPDRDATPTGFRDPSLVPLRSGATGMGSFSHDRTRSASPETTWDNRQPQLPDLEYKGRGIAL